MKRLLCVWGGILIMLVGCSGSINRPQHILIITVDTTRADRLGAYGYESAETPVMDALAEQGVIFEQAQAQVPVTFPSHSTIFTGRYPPTHGVRYNGMFNLGENERTLAEYLSELGWTTYGVPAAFPLTKTTGIAQGFQTYNDMFDRPDITEISVNSERTADEISEIGIEFVNKHENGSTFLWLHYFDPHYPYEPPFPFDSQFRDNPYDGEIAFMDQQIGRVIQAYKDKGWFQDTLVIIVGDHGEGLYDHNEKMHSNLAYQSTLHVPLIVTGPGIKPHREPEPVSLADITPTILEMMGLEGENIQGHSFVNSLNGKSIERHPIYVEAIAGSLVYGWSPIEGIRRGDYKYLRSTDPELYNLSNDPNELENIYSQEPERGADLEGLLQSTLDSWEGGTEDAINAVPMDQAAIDRLASLGYIGGTVSSKARDGAPSPAKFVHLEVDVLAAREAMRNENYERAAVLWQRVLTANPTNRHGLQQAATNARAMGDLEAAEKYLEAAVKTYPEFSPARFDLGELYALTGRPEKALELLKAGFEHEDPPTQPLQYRYAVALVANQKYEEAAAEIAKVIEEGTNFPTFYVLDALVASVQSDWSRAEAAMTAAYELGYRDYELLEKEPMLQPLRSFPGLNDWIEKMRSESQAASGNHSHSTRQNSES